jgi:acyl carrier protein
MELCEPLRNFIVEELVSDEAPLGLDDNLLADGMIDSLGAVRLIAFIEERFGFQIPSKDLVIENFRTIHRLAAYLESRIDGSR